MKILITGASGFIGQKACLYLNNKGFEINAHCRSFCNLPSNINLFKSESLNCIFSGKKPIKDIECVIHLAGKAQEIKKSEKNNHYSYFKNNTEDTLKFASNCAAASVKRFVFVSSIKVNGESTDITESFNENDTPNPSGPYATSKYNAELGLLKIGKETNMEIVIVRPPLIYGEGVKGYFSNILKLLKLKIPLPFGSFINNKRSFIYLENFLDLLNILIKHPKAANELFLCSDDKDLSTTDLVRILSIGMHNRNLIFKIPKFIFLISYIFGQGNLYKKLSQSLSIDNSKVYRLLGWSAPISIKNALKKVAKEYKKNNYL